MVTSELPWLTLDNKQTAPVILATRQTLNQPQHPSITNYTTFFTHNLKALVTQYHCNCSTRCFVFCKEGFYLQLYRQFFVWKGTKKTWHVSHLNTTAPVVMTEIVIVVQTRKARTNGDTRYAFIADVLNVWSFL